jgi:hypothetical protein
MNITHWDKNAGGDGVGAGQMVRVSVDEALKLIEGLAAQLHTGSPNANRPEFFATTNRDTEYFSICVDRDLSNSEIEFAPVDGTLELVKSALERDDPDREWENYRHANLPALVTGRLHELRKRIQELEAKMEVA